MHHHSTACLPHTRDIPIQVDLGGRCRHVLVISKCCANLGRCGYKMQTSIGHFDVDVLP